MTIAQVFLLWAINNGLSPTVQGFNWQEATKYHVANGSDLPSSHLKGARIIPSKSGKITNMLQCELIVEYDFQVRCHEYVP